jgi:hypothetical protein
MGRDIYIIALLKRLPISTPTIWEAAGLNLFGT